ncbi:hypothetical protein P4I92_30135 [Bacillus cereus]
MTREEMFQYMVEQVEKQKGWILGHKELYLMEKSFLMGIDYEKMINNMDNPNQIK